MKVWLWRIRALLGMLQAAYVYWKDAVRHSHPDDVACCNGRDCGCNGITKGELY